MKSKTLVKALLIGMIEIGSRVGAQGLYDWLWTIGERLAEMEGKGLEGEKSGDLRYEPFCPLAAQLETTHYCEILPGQESICVEIPRAGGADKPACADIICVVHHAYRRKRAELAGKECVHLAAKCPMTGSMAFNEEAIRAVGKSKKEIEKLLKTKAVCVFMYLESDEI
ncbi:MAG: hypothetical protein DRN91_04690 [Candidatus Alkanophagales archaeon]|nr:MAG: hypothetical protein DRN91_04690 [Candidatus Alkanophagales archaeon]